MTKVHKIDARLACQVVEELRRRHEPIDDLLKEVGLRRSDVADPETRIPYAATLGLIERAATVLGDASLGLRLGAARQARDRGLLGFVMLHSATLADALLHLQRYFRVVGEGEDIEVERRGPHFVLQFRETSPALRGLRHNSDYIAAAVVRTCRDLTRKPVSPVRAEFIHGQPNQKVDYSEYLGCPVHFRASWDAVIYPAETMQLPVIGADDKLLAVLEASCRRVLGPVVDTQDVVRNVRELIVDRIEKGAPRLKEIAGHLKMSGKTLERRLGERNTSFSKLTEEVRKTLATTYLSETDFRVEQVAYLVGYTEAAALVRAFGKWTGTTPMQFRQQQRVAGS